MCRFRWIIALIFMSLLIAAHESPAQTLEPLPELDLSVTGDRVREQLTEQRAVVERLLGEADVEPSVLAEELGELGLLYLLYDFLEPARTCFDNALLLAGEDHRWPYLAGYVRTLRGAFEPASTLFRRALELDPDDLPSAVRLGRAELQLARPEAARAAFERALAIDDSVAAAHEGLGKAARLAGDTDTAIRHLERALELDPDASSVHYLLAQAYRDQRQLEQATAHLERAGDVAVRFSDPLFRTLAGMAESIQFYITQGAEALDDGDYQSAATAFSSALERDAAFYPAHRGLAISLERLGDRDGARRAYEQALTSVAIDNPTLERKLKAGIRRSLGLLEADAGRGPEALSHYLASLELDRRQPDLLLRVGNALARTRRFEDAVEHYDRLLDIEPEWAPVVLDKRATAMVNLGRGEEAIADFTRAVDAAPEDIRLRLRFARALDHLGKPEQAAVQRHKAERVAGDGPGRVPLLLETARRLTRDGDHATAAERYREALELAPDHRDARLALATVLGHLRRLPAAIDEYRQVTNDSPRHAPAHRGLILALLLDQRYGQARVALQQALAAFPLNAAFALTQVRLLASAPDDHVRDGALALEIARRLEAERPGPVVLEVLALAHAAAGDPDRAADLQRRLIQAVEQNGKPAATLRSRLHAFEMGAVWTVASPEELLVDL